MLTLQDRSFSEYDAMSDEELQEILREDASNPKPEGSDAELILYVMEVLASRRKERNEEKDPAEAWESFRQNYMPPAKQPKRLRSWQKGLVAAAAAVVILIGTTVTAGAFKCDLWASIVKWTENTFHFGTPHVTTPSAPVNNYACAGLQAALDENGISTALVPKWLPEGYVECDVRVSQTPKQRQIYAIYQCGDSKITIRITEHIGLSPSQIEQSDSIVEIYKTNETDYYIFNDNKRLRAAWVVNNYECVIIGELTVEQLKSVIDSIH